MEKITITIGYNHMRGDIRAIREKLCEISEAEATKLYRLAWRMEEHGCSAENVAKAREEARELHMNAYPERLLDPFRVWAYAFKF